jgi:phosphoenolpyruvate synthase/pyruvate phosphate dikinase
MEDLKDFTGAGLNLTLFNVVSADAILQGIRDVWASPYTERSYKWRQRYLLNPENVFPSILIIPSVDVNCSGVLITKGISSGAAEDATAAFSRGAGGAVEGQAAETYLLKKDGKNILLFPAREPTYITLPVTGGVKKEYASFEKGVLNDQNIASLREIDREIRNRLPAFGTIGPYDIELGFKDNKLWLFQVRPFVENKDAIGQIYLESLNPILNDKMIIDLTSTIP